MTNLIARHVALYLFLTCFWIYTCSARGTPAHFLYPDAKDASKFYNGDKILVAYNSHMEQALLSIRCSTLDKVPLTNASMPSNIDAYPVDLTFGPQNQCIFGLETENKTIYSTLFSIAQGSNNPTTHSVSPNSEDPAPGPTPRFKNRALQRRDDTVPLANGSAATISDDEEDEDEDEDEDEPGHNRLQTTLPGDNSTKFELPDGLHCKKLSNEYRSECWEVLKLNDWLTAWRAEVPTCSDPNNENTCIKPDEPWTVAFLRMFADGPNGIDCISAVSNKCTDSEDRTIASDDPLLLRARYRYARHSIILLGSFFIDWVRAVNEAMNDAADLIDGIIRIIDKPKKTRVWLAAVMSLINFGLVIAPPASQLMQAVGDLTNQIIDLVDKGMRQTPGIVKEIWPSKTRDTSNIQIDELMYRYVGVNGTQQEVVDQLGKVLQIVQGAFVDPATPKDISPFLNFAGTGAFSVPTEKRPTLLTSDKTQSGQLLQAFTTFLSSTALMKNNWAVLMLPGVNMAGVQSRTTPCPEWSPSCGGIDWCDSYDDLGLCKGTYWWWSQEHESMYTIVRDEDLDDEADRLLRDIFSKNFATGKTLFENAALCEFASLFAPQNGAVYVSPADLATATNPTLGAGFVYTPPFPDIDGSTVPLNGTHRFLPLKSKVLVELSRRKEFDKRFDRADVGQAPFGAVPEGAGAAEGVGTADVLDFKCVSQMKVIVATAWKDHEWRKNSGFDGD